MEDVILYIANTFGENPYVQLVFAVISVASAVCAVTPTPKPGSTWSKVYKVIEVLAINVGKAKDKAE